MNDILNIEETTTLRQPLTFREKEAVKERCKHTCVYCGCRNKLLLTVEHKTPIKGGGTDEQKNLTCSCYICNQIKGQLTHNEFKKYLKSLEALHDLSKVKLIIEGVKIMVYPKNNPALKRNVK